MLAAVTAYDKEFPPASPLSPGSARRSIAAAVQRRVVVGLIALTTVAVVGCGGGEETTQTTLGEGRTPQDISQCLVAHGWSSEGRAYSAAGTSYVVDAPSDGTPITITAADVDKTFDETLSGAFRISNGEQAVDIDVAGIEISDAERDQVYACAAEAQPVSS